LKIPFQRYSEFSEKILSENSLCLSRDTNSEPSESKSEALLLEWTCSVRHFMWWGVKQIGCEVDHSLRNDGEVNVGI
jgi:hypothetical protein